ncbi:MAG: acyltransferase domain-containing protein, partial [Solirubrobacterales bacterium]
MAAAHVAGVLDLADAAKLVAARGRLMGALPAGGAMAAIEAAEEEVAESIAGREELAIAAINGPTATVISGSEDAVEEIRAQWDAEGRRTKRLVVSHAFHSPLIEPMLEEFGEVAGSLSFSEPEIAIVSNLTGEPLTPEQAIDPAYWVRHAREPVRFADAVATLAKQGTSAYMELGPDPVLCAMVRECLGAEAEAEASFIPTLREGREEKDAISASIAHGHVSGAKLDWESFFAGSGAKRVPLPTYPFQRQRYWLDSAAGTASAGAIGQSDAEHPLLAAAIEDPDGGGLTLTGRLSLATHPWLADHAVHGAVLLPGTAFLELALRAGEEVGARTVEELTLQTPLIFSEAGAVALQVTVSGPGEDGRREIAIHSRPEGGGDELAETSLWTRHATGALSDRSAAVPEALDAWPPQGAEPVEVDYVYDRLAERGFEYGPAFQGLSAAWKDGEQIYAEVALPEEQALEAASFAVHPALLDAAFHAGIDLSLRAGGDGSDADGLPLPFSWRGVHTAAGGASALRVRIDPAAAYEIVLMDEAGAPVLYLDSLLARPVSAEQLDPARRRRSLYRVE